ncbi:MAG TPA: hypothetical protein PK110_01100 [Niabella sp.]|nr:hypothetical protein [Chitinophagaceae bacterium]HRN48739.1 hypothetical protein [Niabella sp.]HRO83394.1 hypothetical protein [Niabella sp.]HUN02433.1 hypothetical protein [Niabella sp.]
MKISHIIAPSALLLLFACNSPEKNSKVENEAEAHKTEVQTDGTHEHEHSEKTTVSVQLDNGKKWKANPETVEGIEKMQAIIRNGIIAKAQPDLLYEPLQKEFQTIFEKCTMKGEAHEQLHHFLTPVKEYLDEMKGNADATDAMEDLKDHLRTFGEYFEL